MKDEAAKGRLREKIKILGNKKALQNMQGLR